MMQSMQHQKKKKQTHAITPTNQFKTNDRHMGLG